MNTKKFKVGDRVRCTYGEGLIVGIITADNQRCIDDSFKEEPWYSIKRDDGRTGGASDGNWAAPQSKIAHLEPEIIDLGEIP